ncbi:PAS domain S-box protein [Flavobacterium frigoris]|uniref:PAS domain S-box-containing protein n=1 Tax=Flavobacterium frigoris TaxID=229204 RepID=A0A1H9J5Q9_FLAFI|nr:PAS domain S-box protein [Flavobacterium frigoris]SEQ82153.1 PAS domain S-box-containing protein [Flavobacterium frigoris]
MKISFEKKVFIGFVINVLVVIASGWIFISRLNKQRDKTMDSILDWVEVALFALSIILLIVVYFIINSQLKAKQTSQKLLFDNRQLLQSIIDNTSNPIFIKRINGEYLLINKQFGDLFKISNDEIVGKTDYDFLPESVAEAYRNSDIEVVKKLRELKTEETIQQKDGKHTYIAVKFPLYDSTGRIYAIGGISTDITERKKMEESLVASDKFFTMSAEMMIIASSTRFVKVNPATIKILGYSEEELLSQPFLNFVYKEDKTNTEGEVVKLETGATTKQFKNRYIGKDGSIKWIQWSTFPDVKTGLLYAVASDVTQLVENEKSLNAADNFFNISLDIMIIASREKFEKINPTMVKTLGYSEEELLKHPFLDFVHPDDKESTQKEIETIRDGSQILEFKNRWICKDGSFKWLIWSAIADPKTRLMYAVARDITTLVQLEKEQQQAIDELYENEEKLRLILENISEGVIVADSQKKVIMANYIANEMFGIEEDDLISANISDHFELYFPDEKTIFPSQNLPMERALNGEVTNDIDIVLWDSDKREKKRVLISGRPLIDLDNNVVAAVVTIKDISKYKHLEEELKKTETKYRQLIGFRKTEDKKEEIKEDGKEKESKLGD